MKAEHRHELKTNDLAKSLLTFQDYVKVYGGRVFLGLAIVILIIVLIVQRMGKSRDEAIKMQDDLAYVIGQIDRLSRAQVVGEGQVTMRPAEADQVRRILQEIREKGSDKKILAEATVAQGDYCWALANFPNVPGATTQPSLRPEKPRDDLQKEAKDTYQQVMIQYPDEAQAVIKARFGLGAVAENEGNWDEAKKQYEAIRDNSAASTSYQNLAKAKIMRLEEIRHPLLVGVVPDKPEVPKITLPSTTTPSETTRPATTGAVAPVTKPVTETTKPTK